MATARPPEDPSRALRIGELAELQALEGRVAPFVAWCEAALLAAVRQ